MTSTGGTTRRSGESAPQILVVDDEPLVRSVTVRMLQGASFQVHQAGNGLEALEFLRGRADELDLVVSDVVMPGLNGVELAERLSIEYPDLPYIFLSGYGIAELAARGITAPCGMLLKPVLPDVLLAEVRRCLRVRS